MQQSTNSLTRLNERKLYLQHMMDELSNELGRLEDEIAEVEGESFDSIMDLPSMRRALAVHDTRTSFEPSAFYSKAGDQIEMVLNNSMYYADHKPDGIVRIRDQETDEIIGFTVLGVSNWIDRLQSGKGIKWIDKAPEWGEKND